MIIFFCLLLLFTPSLKCKCIELLNTFWVNNQVVKACIVGLLRLLYNNVPFSLPHWFLRHQIKICWLSSDQYAHILENNYPTLNEYDLSNSWCMNSTLWWYDVYNLPYVVETAPYFLMSHSNCSPFCSLWK